MAVANWPKLQDNPIAVPETHARVPCFIRLFGNTEYSVFVTDDVVKTAQAGPHGDKFTAWGENLHSTIGPVAKADFSLRVDLQTMDKVEMTGFGFARLSPGLDKLAVTAEPVNPRIAVAPCA